MSTLYILGNGFDLDLGFTTTYSKYIESPQFTGDAFMEVKGLEDSNIQEVKDLAQSIKDKAYNSDLWFDLEMHLTEYYDNLFREIPSSKYSKSLFDKHKLQVLPEIRKSITEFIHRKVDYGYNNKKINITSRAYKLIKDMFIKVFSDSNSKIINFNYTGTSILKKQLKDFIDEDYMDKENINKINKSITSIHGDYKNGLNNDGGIVLGSSEKIIRTNYTKQLLDKPAQKYIINGNRDNDYFTNFQTFIVFGHSFGETDSYYFGNLLQHIIDYSKYNIVELFIYTSDNGESAIIDNIRKYIDYNVLTSRVFPKFNYDDYFENISNEFEEFRGSNFKTK